jgi:uncharacterized membrane protein YedE/YeeE
MPALRDHGRTLAVTIGAIAGALAFLLVALFAGPMIGIAIALIATLLSLPRLRIASTLAFVASGTVAAFAHAAPGRANVIAAVLFGVGLFLGRASHSDQA